MTVFKLYVRCFYYLFLIRFPYRVKRFRIVYVGRDALPHFHLCECLIDLGRARVVWLSRFIVFLAGEDLLRAFGLKRMRELYGPFASFRHFLDEMDIAVGDPPFRNETKSKNV